MGTDDVFVGRFGDPPPTVGVSPSNRFKFAGLKRNKRKGTATLFVEVPSAGQLKLAKTKKLKGASKTVAKAGRVGIPIKLRAKAKSRLKLLAALKTPKLGRLKLKVSVTFAPTGGVPLTLPKRLSLLRRG